MARVLSDEKCIETSVLYWGASGAGASASLGHVYHRVKAPGAPPRDPPAEPGGHFHDLLPLNLGQIRGFQVRVILTTTSTDASVYEHRRAQLADIDGLVFVASTTPDGLRAAQASKLELERALASHQRLLADRPFVACLTHRDAPDALPLDVCVQALGLDGSAVFEAVPPTGVGVFDTLKAISKLVLTQLARP